MAYISIYPAIRKYITENKCPLATPDYISDQEITEIIATLAARHGSDVINSTDSSIAGSPDSDQSKEILQTVCDKAMDNYSKANSCINFGHACLDRKKFWIWTAVGTLVLGGLIALNIFVEHEDYK